MMMICQHYVIILILPLLWLVSTASSFVSPTTQVVVGPHHHHSHRRRVIPIASSSSNAYWRRPQLLLPRLFDKQEPTDDEQPLPNDDENDLKVIVRKDDDDDISVTVMERIQILSYRIGISAAALSISILAIGNVGFLEGTGAKNIDSFVDPSVSALPLVAGTTLLLCPLPNNNNTNAVVKISTLLLGTTTVGSGLVSTIMMTTTDASSVPSWPLGILALMTISIREIWFFGGEYKQECGITLFVLPLMLDALNNPVPFTIPICALGMGVLAAGKLFEPCKEDLIRSNSEFLAK